MTESKTMSQSKDTNTLIFNGMVVKKIASSRRDEKSNRGDFLIFVSLMLVK